MMFPANTRILIIDDMPAVRTWEKKQLNRLGFKNIFEAENGVQALEILMKQLDRGDAIELIVSDWKMPEMDGVALFQALQKNDDLKKIPFIMASAETEAPKVIEAAKIGISAYITKPFEIEILKKRMELVWEKTYGGDEEIL